MDRYIDNNETQTYGPKLRENIAAAFTDPAPVRAFIQYLIGLQKTADETMATALARAGGAQEGLSKATADKAPEVTRARTLLAGFSQHLTSKKTLGEWSGRPEKFLPGGLSAIGNDTSSVLAGVRKVIKVLGDDASVPDAKKFAKLFVAAEKSLSGAAAKSGAALKATRKGLSEQSAEKAGWTRQYRGNALVIEGLLMMAGRSAELATLVPHLGVSGGAKKGAKGKGTKGTGAKGGESAAGGA